MQFALRCQECNQISYHRPETFYVAWQESIEVVKKGTGKNLNGKEVNLFITLTCQCGHVGEFKSPMYRYAFRVIFEELSKQS